MPVKRGKDKYGSYYQWGSATKYYYIHNNPKSRELAKTKAKRQGQAIKISESK